MPSFKEIKRSILIGIWFMFLTFPIMVIRVNTVEDIIEWRWKNMALVGAGSFILSFFWRYMNQQKEQEKNNTVPDVTLTKQIIKRLTEDKKLLIPVSSVLAAFILAFPFIFSMYQTNIMITALIYVMLGLGLNIVVGLAGLLDLGYVAFYAVGAYSYGLLNYHFQLGFWAALPIGACIAALFGIILGYPVLRLRGDYLAIVTLGFGEIIRLILENWDDVTFGPSGIANIPRPSFFGIETSLHTNTVFIYFLMICLVILTIFIVSRLQNSRIGRAWIALREDEIACQAMGVDKAKTKLTAFALGATWAGIGGVVFAAKTTFINPASFTIWESIIILCIVVIGGMGSLVGVVLGALVLILGPEYLRAFSEYRMLLFGVLLVGMMIFRPGGFIPNIRRTYQFKEKK